MVPWMDAADPGRVHTEGRMARAALEDARDKVAALLGARSREVVFTSGATESVHTAVFGAAALQPDEPIVLSGVEHSCVRDSSARHLHHVVGVDRLGRIDAAALTATDAALVHCQWGNHEVGTVQPVAEVVDRCRERGVLVHVDAAAAAGHVPIAFDDLGADLMSVSAHKFGGPQGIGALLVRRGLRVRPLLVGGEQERARRAGMENVAAIAGFGAVASALAQPGRLDAEAGAAHGQTVRVLADLPEGVVTYGDIDSRLPHIVCLGVEGVEAEAVLLGLDQAGIAAHSGSACSSESLEPSPVLEAMGVDAERSLRVSVGWTTTDDDIDALVDALPKVVSRLRALGAR
ncbi:MAG: hypothetical protein JWP02_2049 [Acidimicrobiales bacterium]|nr:hypothetical protein [Acidimicrobiales bacterium]